MYSHDFHPTFSKAEIFSTFPLETSGIDMGCHIHKQHSRLILVKCITGRNEITAITEEEHEVTVVSPSGTPETLCCTTVLTSQILH
jgi:hypothetical protein